MTGTTDTTDNRDDGQPAGWYRDPAPPNPAFPTTVRFWDGAGWTTRTRPASKRERQAWQQELLAQQREYAGQLVARAEAGDAVAQQQLAMATAPPERSVTPDGQQLAGWWLRAGALLLDGVATLVLGLLFSWPWVREVAHGYRLYIDDVVSAAQAGAPTPDPSAFMSTLAGPLAMITVVFLLVDFVYEVAFLKGFQATPGKLLLGLEVRLRERPGPLSWSTVLLRWLGKSGVGLLRLLPLGSLVSGVYSLLDYLWPLWDHRRQALHDKLAHTNVVRRA
jgi:uncharacterized RDD family membrane protein YckC